MTFALTNAPDTYQLAINIVLTNFKSKTCLVYMDDVFIYSNSVDEHINHIDEILSTLVDAGVTLRISKCTFSNDKVEYLGHAICPGKLEVDNAHTNSLPTGNPLPPKSNDVPSWGYATSVDRLLRTLPALAIHSTNLYTKQLQTR